MSTPAAAPAQAGPRVDERLRHEPLWRRMLVPPSVGAAIEAVVVFVFFSAVDETGTFNSPSGVASWMGVSASFGIMACALALLGPAAATRAAGSNSGGRPMHRLAISILFSACALSAWARPSAPPPPIPDDDIGFANPQSISNTSP